MGGRRSRNSAIRSPGALFRRLLTSRSLPAAVYGVTLAAVGFGLLHPVGSGEARPLMQAVVVPPAAGRVLRDVARELHSQVGGLRPGMRLYEEQVRRFALLAGFAPPVGSSEADITASLEMPAMALAGPVTEMRTAYAPSLGVLPARPTGPGRVSLRTARSTPAPRRAVTLLDSASLDLAPPLPGQEGRPSLFPARRGFLGSSFGWRSDPFTGRRTFHEGQDIVAPAGTPVLAPADGTVVQAARYGSLGRAVFIGHDDGVVTRFGHLSRIAVEAGDRVRRGQVIGFVGSSGRSLGSHLHYEVTVNGEKVDPRPFLPVEPVSSPWPMESEPLPAPHAEGVETVLDSLPFVW